jgi:hypothetical protein
MMVDRILEPAQEVDVPAWWCTPCKRRLFSGGRAPVPGWQPIEGAIQRKTDSRQVHSPLLVYTRHMLE